MSPRFLCVIPGGSGASRQSFCERGSVFSACGVFVDDQDNGGCFLFCWRLMLLWVMVWDLRTLAQFLGNEMSPGLFQDFMNGYIKY